MGHDHLRNDNECQNCGFRVEVEYCSKCGQKNTETRQSFTHLVGHFAEDLTHYDGAFWKTIKYLLFRPAKLTKEYLEGHRMRYVPPVKLYIFISFVTFLLIGLLSDKEYKKDGEFGLFKIENKTTSEEKDPKKRELINENVGREYTSLKEMDSIEKTLPEALRLNYLSYITYKTIFKATEIEKEKGKEKEKIFLEAFTHLLPKVLFIYMPIFAFWLWLFHGKKRWYFFDHGIFTLHYFSFLLLLIAIIKIITWLLSFVFNETVHSSIYIILISLLFLYSLFYFFRSHRIMYNEKRSISRLKCSIIFIINSILIAIVLLASMIYAILNVH